MPRKEGGIYHPLGRSFLKNLFSRGVDILLLFGCVNQLQADDLVIALDPDQSDPLGVASDRPHVFQRDPHQHSIGGHHHGIPIPGKGPR